MFNIFPYVFQTTFNTLMNSDFIDSIIDSVLNNETVNNMHKKYVGFAVNFSNPFK